MATVALSQALAFAYFPCSEVLHVKCRLPSALFLLRHVGELNFYLRIDFGLCRTF